MYNLMQQMLVSGVGMITSPHFEHYASPVTQEMRLHTTLIKFYTIAEYTQRHERYNRRMRLLCGCIAEEVREQNAFYIQKHLLMHGTKISQEIVQTIADCDKVNISFAANPTIVHMEYFRAQAKKIVARAKIMYEGEE